MTDELRAAAERLRRVNAGEDEWLVYYRGDGEYYDSSVARNLRLADEDLLARAYLAEHPADDGEPVSEEWLGSIGQRCLPATSLDFRFGPHGGTVRIECRGTALPPSERVWYFENHPLPTRGHVRRLLSALGVKP